MTSRERAALIEEIARTMCLHRPMPVCRCDDVGRCQASRDNLLGEYGSYAITAPAVLDAIASAKSRAAAVYASDPPSLVERITREAWATWDASDEIVLIADDSEEKAP